jgi:tetratricopeptide (TPR) repeat protein
MGQKSRAEVIVLGSFSSLGGSLRIDVQLHDAGTGQPIATERLVVDKPGDILTQIDLLSLKIAARLGAAPDGQQNKKGLAEVMTDNLQAYRCYSLAMGKAWALESTEAIALLERSLALDPQFAMAHARIGYVYINWGKPDKARPHLEKAFQISDRLTEKDRLLITAWYEIANLDYSGAIITFRKIIAQYPFEVEAYWRLSHLLQGENRLDESVDVAKQGLAIDPEAKDLYNLLGGIYAILSRHDESIRMHQRYVELAREEPNAHDSLGLSYQCAGRYDEAMQEYNRALALKPDFEIALIHLANVHFQMGHYQTAIDHYKRYIAIAPSDEERGRGQASIFYVYLKKGNRYRAEQEAKKAALLTPAVTWAALLFALEQGDLARAERLKEQYLARWSHQTERGARVNRRGYYQLRGYFALKSGHAAEALEEFKAALRNRPPIWNLDWFDDCLANAYLELGQLDEAIAEYERILSLNPNFALAHYHLAQAYERKGEREQARSHYERFLQIWNQADPDLPEVIAARKAWQALA